MLSELERLLLPGWAGQVTDEELEYIQESLYQDKQLSFRWGFAPSQKTRSTTAILKVAMWGDQEDRLHNARLHRKKYFALERAKTSGNPIRERYSLQSGS